MFWREGFTAAASLLLADAITEGYGGVGVLFKFSDICFYKGIIIM